MIQLAYVGPVEAVSPWLLRAVGRAAGRFAALCADSMDQAEKAASEFGARWPFDDVDAMLREVRPQGVIVAVPWPQRAAVVKRCLASGANVLTAGLPCAAPGGSRPRRWVFGAAALRYSPAGALIQRLIESGRLGEPLSLTVRHVRPRRARSAEESAWPVGRDTLFEAVDWLHALCGPAGEAFARGHPDGALSAVLVTKRDVPVALTVHEHGRPETEGLSMELRSVDGVLLTLRRGMRMTCVSGTRVLATHQPAYAASDPAVELGCAGLVSEFVRRLEEPADRAASTADAWKPAAATVEALLKSLSRAGPVKIGGARATAERV